MGIKRYRDLDIWKKGVELVKGIYKLTGKFPQQEIYGLVSQMRRSAVSIPSNVADRTILFLIWTFPIFPGLKSFGNLILITDFII